MENTITLYPISKLLGKNFYIPSYQRGYRWDKQQVEDLLNDIYSFAKKEKTPKEFYCLQPIVLKSREWNRMTESGSAEKVSGWELVDGQQRLTTIRILFSYLIKVHLKGETLNKEYGLDIFKLDYETREGTELFLNSDDLGSTHNANIDFHFISEAYNTIKEWFESKEKQKAIRESIIRTLVCDFENREAEGIVQVIWYEIEKKKNPIDTFIRINLGKISLTNAELIKALFLQERNFGNDLNELAKLRQLEIANEWDNIENYLQDDDFWWFLNRGANKAPSRIEYIFDLICSIATRKNPELALKIGSDKYVTFRYFYQKLEGNNSFEFIKNEWDTVTNYFNTFVEWYNNPVWYHYIGFLIYCGESVVDLFEITEKPNISKEDITNLLKSRIQKIFSKVSWTADENNEKFLSLKYPNDNNDIRKLLLLFNLQYIVNQCENNNMIFKFPFKTFKEEEWDVEHIDSHTENPLIDRATQVEWLKTAMVDLAEILEDEILTSRINEFIDNLNSKEPFELIQKEIVKKAGEDFNDNNVKNNIGNLTLLDSQTNRSYGNSLFSTKRRIIIEKDSKGTFIPIWTKNLFLKYFETNTSSRTKWTESDIVKYRNIIATTLINFLPNKN